MLPQFLWDEGQPHASKPHDYYEYERPEVIRLVPEEATRILDVGCAAGHLGRRLKELGTKEKKWLA